VTQAQIRPVHFLSYTVSQEPIFAARLLSSSPSNCADSPRRSRTSLRCFPQHCNATGSGAARAEEWCQQSQQPPVRLGVCWGAERDPQSPCGSRRCRRLPVGRVGGLGAVSGRRCVGSLGGGNRGGAGIVGGCAVPLDGLAVGWGGRRRGVTYKRRQPHQVSSATFTCHVSDQLRSC